MTMKTHVLISLMLMAMLAPTGFAALTELPEGYMTGWGGKSTYYQNLGNGDFLYGVIEFAVYDTQAEGYSWLTAPGDHQYLYAYQIFSDAEATGALTYFGLTDIEAGAITSAEENLDTAESTGGIDAESTGTNLSKTKAYFEFADGLLVANEKSFFLLLGSDYAPVVGGYEVLQSPDDGEVPNPGDDGTPTPEPATLVLLLGGALLSLRKRR